MSSFTRAWLAAALPERYRLLEPLAPGAQGVVWRARDAELGQEVVIKVRRRSFPGDPSLQREVAALLALDRPCVSRLLEVGALPLGERAEDEALYLVTTYVSGSSFPALGRHPWVALRLPLIGLLRALRHVHAEGIVHRDLRPDHVRIRGDEVILLDFGGAFGEGVDARGPHPQGGVGTWRYMAPEQMLSPETVTAAADLYAVGVMAYEALAGQPPHSLEDLQAARRYDERAPLGELRPDLPPEVIALIEGLLVTRPAQRIASAERALAILGEPAEAEISEAFRHWGARIPSDEALAEQLYGPERIFGRRTRALALLWRRAGRAEEIAAELSAWLAAGRARAEEGHLVLDEPDLLWLEGDTPLRFPATSAESTASDPPEVERLHALLHLAWPGLPASVVERWPADHVEQLVHSGRAFWTRDPRLLRALTLPASWPSLGARERKALHAEVAALLPDQAPSKVRHLLAAGEASRAAEVALMSAEALYAQGLVPDALTRLDLGLMVARTLGSADLEERLLARRTWMGLSATTEATTTRSTYEIVRSLLPETKRRSLLALVDGVRAARRGRAQEALEQLGELAPFDDERLDRWRVGAAVEAGLHADAETLRTALEAARAWAAARGTRSAAADLAGWEGNACYRESDFAGAVVQLQRAVAEKDHGSGRLSSWGSLAAALLELRRWEEAEQSAGALRDEAVRLRVSVHAAVAEWVLRAIAWRRGLALPVDRALVLASRELRRDVRRAQILMTEAAFAWRAGNRDAAHALAMEAASVWRAAKHGALVMAESLAVVCAPARDVAACEAAASEAAGAAAGPLPGLALQGLAVILLETPSLRPRWVPEGQRAWQKLPLNLAYGVRELVDLSQIFGPEGILDHSPPSPAMDG